MGPGQVLWAGSGRGVVVDAVQRWRRRSSHRPRQGGRIEEEWASPADANLVSSTPQCMNGRGERRLAG